MQNRRLARWGVLWCVSHLAWGICSAVAVGQQTDAATRDYAAAVAMQNRGVYDLAAQAWQEFLKNHAQDARVGKAQHYLGVCYYQQGQFDAALRTLQTTLNNYPKSELEPASLLYLGVTQFSLAQSGKTSMYDESAKTFRTLLSKHPNGEYVPDARYYLGECVYARGNKAEAIEHYSQFLAKYPKNKLAPEATYALGVAQEESGQPEAAGKTYDTFLAQFTQHRLATEVGMRRGETLLAAGQAAEAAKRFAAASAAPGFALADFALLRQGDALVQLKQYAEAAKIYGSVPAKYPQSQHGSRASLWAGKCLFLAGNYADARQALQGLADGGSPLAPEASHWLAQTQLKSKQAEAALAVVEKALPQAGQGPIAAQLLLDRADAVFELPQRRKEAVALYAAAAEKYPQEPVAPQALYMAAFTAIEQGDATAGLDYANKFLAAYKDHALTADAMHVAAEGNVLLGKFAEADQLYRELLRQYPGHADTELWRVRQVVALFAQKKFDETIKTLHPLVGLFRSVDSIAEARFLIGSSQLELNRPQEAITSLTASLAAQPKWRQADETLLALAQAYRQTNDLEKAKATVARVLTEFPESRFADRARYRLGEYFWLQGDYAGAAREYRQVVEKFPASPLAPHAMHELGCAQLNQKDVAGAESTLTGFLERFPKHALVARAHYARGMARHQLKKFAPAIEDLQAMLAADPGSKDKSDARLLLGLCQLELKQYDAAAATLQGLLRDDPSYTSADKVYYQLAWALKLSGKDDEAGKTFAELANHSPDSPLAAEAQHNVGEAFYRDKDYRAAAKAYYAAVQKADGTPLGEKATHKLGWCYYHLEKYDDAQKTFGYQVKKYPNGPLVADGSLMVAECLFKQERFADALSTYDGLKNFSSREFESLALLHAGQAASQLKQWDKSVEWLTRSVQQTPDAAQAPEALYELGWALQNLGKRDDALARYREVVAKTDREVAARAQFMIGELQFENKKHSDAVLSFFKAAAYGYPKWQADATYEAARCLEVLGKKAQAEKMYQELLEKHPASDRVPLARQRLTDLRR